MFNQDISSTEEQLKRQKSALRLNVQSVDVENKTGVINNYKVTLDDCTCRDYFVRRLPCKHMYRLAHELGVLVLPGKVANDKTVKNFKEEREEKKQIYQKALDLPEDARLLLYEISRGECKLQPCEEVKQILDLLVGAGFVELRQPTEKELYSSVTIKDLSAVIPDMPKGKKADLIAYLREKAPEFEQGLLKNFNEKCIIAHWSSAYEVHRVGIQRKITPYKGTDNFICIEL